MKHHLFVYGSLSPDAAPPEVRHVVKQLRRIGAAYVRGRLYDLGDYPAAVLDPSADRLIRGEVFEVPSIPGIFEALDKYEEFDPRNPGGSLFRRTKTRVKLTEGGYLDSWIYVYNREPPGAALQISGD